MSPSECAYDPGPDARSPPANEAIVAGGVRAKTIRQIPPRRDAPQYPEDAVEDIVHPAYATWLVLVVGKFIAHNSQFPGLAP